MINAIHAMLHHPETGWDPIPAKHCEAYTAHASETFDAGVILRMEQSIGCLAGKRILDLGGGPGQYSIEFALRGAQVTWHDVSHNYLRVARQHAENCGASLDFSIGYLEDANRLVPNSYDLVFVRVCWNYCRSDRRFARLVYSLVRPGGVAYVESNTPAFAQPRGLRRIQYWLDGNVRLKIGHPFPPRGRIAAFFQQMPIRHMETDYNSPLVDKILVFK